MARAILMCRCSCRVMKQFVERIDVYGDSKVGDRQFVGEVEFG